MSEQESPAGMSGRGPKGRVRVLDTTLRDGEQSPGASMNLSEKKRVAQALAALGVDIIELGFPVASPGDFEAVQTIARQLDEQEGPIACALSRASFADIDRTFEALRDAPRGRIHLFLATSPLHREHKLKLSPDEVVARATEAVRYARERFEDVQFSAEDAARTELDFLAEVTERVIEAGATTVNIPDTVGYALPAQYAGTIAHLLRTVHGIDEVVLSVHCHNDLGLAVANSLAALQAGAGQVECTINGIGERAGNCALEEVVMAIRTRADSLGLRTGIRTERLYATSRLVSEVTGMVVQRNKAIVGRNAFAHEAGIHQHGVLAHAGTYEIMRPEDVGFDKSTLVLGKHSGRHLLRERVRALGVDLDEAGLDRLFEDMKRLADRKKEIDDADLELLLLQTGEADARPLWGLCTVQASAGAESAMRATVCLLHRDGHRVEAAGSGLGLVESIAKAVFRITGVHARVCEHRVEASSQGGQAQARVTVEIEEAGRRATGRAASADLLEGAALACVDAVRRLARPSAEAATETAERRVSVG